VKSVSEVCQSAEKLCIKIVLVGGLFAEFTEEIGQDYPPFPKTNDADGEGAQAAASPVPHPLFQAKAKAKKASPRRLFAIGWKLALRA
jgi:hypothetical protein